MKPNIDGGVHDNVLVDQADQIVEHIHHPISDVVRGAAPPGPYDGGAQRHGGLSAVLVDEAGVGHRGEHDLAAPLGAIVVLGRRQPRRRFDEPCQQGGLAKGDMPCRLAEIALRRRLDSVGAGAEIDPVEIKLQDLGLGKLVLQPQRQHDFLKLAHHFAVAREEKILGELLRNGRAALGDAAMEQVGHDCAGQSDRIDPVMAIETPVLDREKGIGQVGRHFIDRDCGAAHLAAGREDATVSGIDLDGRWTLGDCQRLDRRQVERDPGE